MIAAAVVLGFFVQAARAQDSTSNASDTNNTNLVQQGDPSRPALQHRFPRYRIQRSDEMDINFPLVPEYNQTVTVQPDGFIALNDIGEIHVEGMTVDELASAVKKAYADGHILHDPVVTINLKDFQKPYFSALGQVNKPGKYELREDITVAEAIALAGGFTPTSAKHSEVLLFRKQSNDLIEVKKINIKKMLNEGNLSEDMYLQPGDMVFVPQNFLSKIAPFLPSYSVSLFVSQQKY
jgi:polysaccharide export outer membrane protein